MPYLFGAYFVLWAVTFGYVFYMSSRQKRLQRELTQLMQKSVSSPSAPGSETEKVRGRSA